jgi:2-oxoisovalerate dehydrogenase E1 component
VRYLGHAGADVETSYRSPAATRADLARDPLLATAAWLVAAGLRTGAELASEYLAARERVREVALAAARCPQLGSAAAVMRPLAPRSPAEVARLARSDAAAQEPVTEPLTLALAINGALAEALDGHPEVLLFGEDIAAKGGVYGVTRGLHARFGAGRVFDTLLDETSILGLALGSAVSGFVPVPEIQYLAYLHNAEDQLRGEAATLQFFSQGRYRNGMVVRIAGYGYQKGFGGHFHNDDSVAVLRDIPGLVIASPARPDDAAAMLRTCVAAAKVDGSVCAFLEPIALYHTRDLYEEGDGLWLATPSPSHVPLGSARTYGDGRDLTILTWGNGLPMSLRVTRRLAQRGVEARVVDLRWLAPLPIEDIAREAVATQRVLVVDETRRTGGVSEGIIATLIDVGFDGQLARVTSKDSFVPLGDAANLVLLSEAEIEAAALALV